MQSCNYQQNSCKSLFGCPAFDHVHGRMPGTIYIVLYIYKSLIGMYELIHPYFSSGSSRSNETSQVAIFIKHRRCNNFNALLYLACLRKFECNQKLCFHITKST